MSVPSDPVIFRLKAVIAGISPMIWRRLLIHSGTTIAELHYLLQIVLSWSDYHLHRFIIHGKPYSIHRTPLQVREKGLNQEWRKTFE